MPLDRYLIDHCSPTLANLKTANLFSCRYSSQEQLAGQVLSWHRALESKGVCLRLLRAKNGCALIYVYRPLRLAADLCKPGVAEFLAGCGYQSLAPNEALARLSERLCSQEGFPHEIGLFLSYPLGDVQGFIENGGADGDDIEGGAMTAPISDMLQNIFGQGGNFFEVLPPAARPFVEEGGKRLVAQFQPAARRDAVRLVAELFGVIFRRGGEQIALDDVGMQLRHAVDAAGDEHGEARHAVGFSRADRHLCRLLRRTAEGGELPPRERIQPL